MLTYAQLQQKFEAATGDVRKMQAEMEVLRRDRDFWRKQANILMNSHRGMLDLLERRHVSSKEPLTG